MARYPRHGCHPHRQRVARAAHVVAVVPRRALRPPDRWAPYASLNFRLPPEWTRQLLDRPIAADVLRSRQPVSISDVTVASSVPAGLVEEIGTSSLWVAPLEVGGRRGPRSRRNRPQPAVTRPSAPGRRYWRLLSAKVGRGATRRSGRPKRNCCSSSRRCHSMTRRWPTPRRAGVDA